MLLLPPVLSCFHFFDFAYYTKTGNIAYTSKVHLIKNQFSMKKIPHGFLCTYEIKHNKKVNLTNISNFIPKYSIFYLI